MLPHLNCFLPGPGRRWPAAARISSASNSDNVESGGRVIIECSKAPLSHIPSSLNVDFRTVQETCQSIHAAIAVDRTIVFVAAGSIESNFEAVKLCIFSDLIVQVVSVDR